MSLRSKTKYCDIEGCNIASNKAHKMFDHFLSRHADVSRGAWRMEQERLSTLRAKNAASKPLKKCDYCTYETPVTRFLLIHQIRRHGLRQTWRPLKQLGRGASCDICSHFSRYKAKLLVHFKQHHRERIWRGAEEANKEEGRNFGCDSCGYASKAPGSLFIHIVRKHSEPGPDAGLQRLRGLRRKFPPKPVRFLCDECGSGWTNSKDLQLHFLCRHAEKTKLSWKKAAMEQKESEAQRRAAKEPTACDDCSRRFKTYYNMRLHVLGRPCAAAPVCDECGARFSTIRHASRHISMTHLGQSPRIRHIAEAQPGSILLLGDWWDERKALKLSEINCHGFSDIYRSHSIFGKVLWSGLVIACISLFVMGIFNEANIYMDGSRASRVTTHHTDNLSLPDIAVCLPTPLNVTRLLADGFSLAQISAFHFHFQENPYKQLLGYDVYKLPPEEDDSVGIDWGEFVHNYSANCEDVLAQCTKDRKSFDCCSKADEIFHEKLGKCFVFRDLSQTEESVHTGLVILARSDKSLMIPPEAQSATLMPMEHGVILEMSDHYMPPFAYGAHGQLLIPSDSLSYITLEKTQYIKEIDCIPGEQKIGFSKGRCKKECVGRVISDVCNCTLLGFPVSGPFEHICHPTSIGDCMQRYKAQGFSLGDHPVNVRCIADECGIPCEQSFYRITTSFLPINSPAVATARRQFGGETRMGYYEFTKFHIYYKDLVFTRIVEFEILTPHNVLSSLGGQLGLYMGASLITVVQLCVIAFNNLKKGLTRLPRLSQRITNVNDATPQRKS